MSGSSETDSDFVTEVVARGELLSLLREQPRTGPTLAKHANVSRSTVHRVTETLQELGLVDKPDERFYLTGLGRLVAAEFEQFRRRVETARRLEPFLNTVDPSAVDVPLESFADVTVTAPRPRQAHVGVKRIIELIERSDSLRMFSSIISPLYVDAALAEMLDGMEITVLFDAEVMDIVGTRFAEEARRAFETGRFHVAVVEEVPFELFLFDDRMGMAAHDDAAVARAFVESRAPEARAWAEELFEEYAAGADEVTL